MLNHAGEVKFYFKGGGTCTDARDKMALSLHMNIIRLTCKDWVIMATLLTQHAGMLICGEQNIHTVSIMMKWKKRGNPFSSVGLSPEQPMARLMFPSASWCLSSRSCSSIGSKGCFHFSTQCFTFFLSLQENTESNVLQAACIVINFIIMII